MLAVLMLLGGAVLTIAYAVWIGQRSEKARQMEGELNDIRAAKHARDRLDRDASFASRVRARFTRKLL